MPSWLKRNSVGNTLYRIAALLISLAIVLAYRTAADSAFAVLLWPYAKVTEIFFNIPMTYVSGLGYTSYHANFVISPACSGVYFFVMLFLMLATIFVSKFTGVRKAVWLAVSGIGAAVVSLLISCIRIVGSVPFVAHYKFATLHTAFGAMLYCAAIIASYVIINKLLRRSQDEKAQ